jgi:hypothetical protein
MGFTRAGGIWRCPFSRWVEHGRPLQETRERLAVFTVADEAEAA